VKQREVQDGDGVRWVCAQALAGVGSSVEAEAAELVEGDDGTVPVVCTPSGGAQTVRIEVERGWEERMSDDALLAAIASARDA